MKANQILQRGGSVMVGGALTVARFAGSAAGRSFGLIQPARRPSAAAKPDMDDVTLARKVETEIFRGADAPKSKVNVNAVDGVVWLRGEVQHPDEISGLEQQVQAIPEVRGVENLLHLPKTPAPTRADTPPRQQRTRSSTRRSPREQTQGRVTDDRTDAIEREAEPSPAARARTGEGRTPAPFGSTKEPGQDT